MKAALTYVLAAVLLLVALSLQGCGCNSENVAKCAFAVSGTDYKTICGALDTYVGCIKDTGCCAEKLWADAIDSSVKLYSEYCKDDNALKNSCS